MASTSSTRSESPVDIDFSVIRTSIQMGHKMIDQILNGIHYGSEEVRNLLREECDFILECKVCRNLFRSFPNFVAHKRVYCMEYYEEKVGHDNLAPVPEDEETVVIQPEAPEESNHAIKSDAANPRNSSVASSNIDKVINKTFDGKSKEYQLYTKIAEDLEKRKFTKVTNTITLNPIATTSNAVEVVHAKENRLSEINSGCSPKKQSPVKLNGTAPTGSPVKKKNSVLAVCADLAKKKDGKIVATSFVNALPTRASTRSRKSSPRKSIEYLENTNSETSKNSKSVGTEADMEMSEWKEDSSSDDSKVTNDASDKEWLKFCDVKNCMCKVCKRSFSSMYNLKFHAKMKHVSSVAQYACPNCELTFRYFTSLVRHLRKVHLKSESYINNMKMKLHRRKSTEDLEVDQNEISSSSSGDNTSSPRKETKNMLSFSTGWKKCDKCGKVCWKAKSFYRHYNTCKGPASNSISKSATNSPVKSGKQNNGKESQRNATALLKLQQKLRAGVIQSSSAENTVKPKVREKISQSESDSKGNARDKKPADGSVEINTNTSELFKALTKPHIGESNELKSRNSTPDLKEIGQSKIYNLRPSNQVNVQDEKTSGTVSKETSKFDSKDREHSDKNKEVQANNGTQAFKKLEERLVREAGLKDTQRTEKTVEVAVKPYGTRHSSQLKCNVSEIKETPGIETKETVRIRQLSSESGKEDSLGKVKEQRMLRESPEIKQLEEKLTREITAKQYETRHATQVKSIALEAKVPSVTEIKDVSGRIRKLSSESGKEDSLTKMKEQRFLREPTEIKHLEEKLTREVTAKSYDTRHASQVKNILSEGKEAHVTEAKDVTGRNSKSSSEAGKEDSSTKMKEQRVLRESPEIKQLEEKLTREALGYDKLAGAKESNKSVQLDKEEEVKSAENRKSLHKDVPIKVKETIITDTFEEPEIVETRQSAKRTSSREAENRKEHISEKLREKIASQELAIHDRKARKSRSMSKESDTKTDRKQDNTPEKMHLLTNLSPVASPSRSSVLPSSPTPSNQSNSGDSYNMKFKMTVQEMAELVESASLTKFAKERKKRARNILNTKQAKESQKVAACLAKPMKRQYRKRNVIIRNVYGTRNKKPNEIAVENRNIHSTKLSGGNSNTGFSQNDLSPKSRTGDIPSRDSSREKQVETKRLSREQKRLQNSAGFVEENFYAVSSLRDSSKDRQSDAETEQRKLSRERKRLENSEGFVDKGLNYESDSSVERDRHSLKKLIKNDDISEATNITKERIMVEKSSADNIQMNVDQLTSTKTLPVKGSSSIHHVNVANEANDEQIEKLDEKMKQNNSGVKKTVLYVGKDFTEKIKSIQQRKNDVSSVPLNKEYSNRSISGSDTEENTTNFNEIKVGQMKPSITSVENSTKLPHPKATDEKDDQKEQSSKRNVETKQTSTEIDEQKDSPKHRTRLATGSIFFDSELLKLSPSKVEKKIAELNKASDGSKGRLAKGTKCDNELTLVKKRLSLSPEKVTVKAASQHQRTKSGPQRYSLSTGVKQCQKCNKTFWKKRTYMLHLSNSRCSDKNKSRMARKRAHSQSPEGRVLEDSSSGKEIRNIKKAKREVRTSENIIKRNINEEKVTQDLTNKESESDKKMPQKPLTKHSGNSDRTTEETETANRAHVSVNTDEMGRTEVGKNIINLRTSVSSSKEQNEQSDVTREHMSLRTKGDEAGSSLGNVSGNNIELETVTELNVKIVSNDGETVKSGKEKYVGKSLSHEVENNGYNSRAAEIEMSGNSGDSQSEKVKSPEKLSKQTREPFQDHGSVSDTRNKKEENVISQKDKPEHMGIIKETDSQSDFPKTKKGLNTVNEQLPGNSSTVNTTDEIPGPSTSMSSLFSEKSDDNDSEFSGFSEDDLKISEQELSQMDLEEHDELEDYLADIASDDDLAELSDDPCSDDDIDHDLKPSSQSASVPQRPVRKSAQNRFAHVEEIWVYKEPGKPVVEKTKGVKNREYVVDVTNPSKLQCHNSKDVDRLIDEKNLKCRQCETPCTSISNLRRHVIRHLGWKRYKCKHCAYSCYDMSYCRQHVLRAHDENLTNKNFNKFITDLKKEATKKRAAKRTSTLHKSKQQSFDDDTYRKPKPYGTNSGSGQKLNAEPVKLNTPNISGQKSYANQCSSSSKAPLVKASVVKDELGAESNKVDMADFIVKTEGIKVSSVKKETAPRSEQKIKTAETPLDRARMNLAKALCEK